VFEIDRNLELKMISKSISVLNKYGEYLCCEKITRFNGVITG